MSLLTVLAPMRLEAWALRMKLLDVRVMAAGIANSQDLWIGVSRD